MHVVGLTKLDVEGYGNRLNSSISELRERADTSQLEDTSLSEGNQSILAPLILQPRS